MNSFFFFSLAGSKLRRLRSAIDANLITTPYPIEYQDVHVIAGVLKSYLRDLPDPLLTFKLYDEFIAAAQQNTEDARKSAILNAIKKLPEENYLNLRYLMKFLGLSETKLVHVSSYINWLLFSIYRIIITKS